MTHEEIQQLAALDAIHAASPEEAEMLRKHLEGCSDCRRVADEMTEAAALMALSIDPVAPPPQVREQILDDLRESGRAVTMERPLPPSPPRWWLVAAAIIALAFWGFTALRLRHTREEMLVLRARVNQLAAERTQLSETLAALSGSKTIELAGQAMAPTASARVFLDPAHRRAFVFFRGLPVNPAGKDYQLWIVRADQVAPQSAGVFKVDQTGNASLVVQNLPVDTLIKALAVTLERKGGVEAPTGEKYLLGS
jgi:anti-sigma-K factor RskA